MERFFGYGFDATMIVSTSSFSISATFWISNAAAPHLASLTGMANKNLKTQHHRISCATDKAAWRTRKIQIFTFAFECVFLL